jgi:hypothetical protein
MRRRRLAVLLAMLILALAQHACTGARKVAPTTAPSLPGAGRNSKAPPPGAVVLFDGKDESQWIYKKGGGPTTWPVVDGAMEVHGGNIITKDKFGDFTLHIEFWCPNLPPNVKGQGRGNSGVYLQDRYEIQVLDSYGVNPIGLGDCGAIYNQKIPDVNACLPPEQWQTYDITFRAARFDSSGKKTENARVTVVQNGQTIHKDAEIKQPTGEGEPESPAPGPIRLQDHHNKVRFRNIWIVPAGKDAK